MVAVVTSALPCQRFVGPPLPQVYLKVVTSGQLLDCCHFDFITFSVIEVASTTGGVNDITEDCYYK